MKDKRDPLEVKDFSGGLVTNIGLTNMDPKTSPDCLNVYTEGQILRKRNGNSDLNTATVAAGSGGNGMYNWVKSATQQELLGTFGSKLYKMDLVGSVWDGTFDAVAADAENGTPFLEGFMHFRSFSGTLLFTNESRMKPQKMLASDTSHFNIEFGGSGDAPSAKFIEVWKQHVWLANIGQGGTLTEECNAIGSWATAGTSAQATFQSAETFHLTGSAGTEASFKQDIGNIPDDYIVEMRTHFNTLNTDTDGDYAEVNWHNGVTKVQARWTSSALQIYDGAAWSEVGVDLVDQDTWAVWKFVVTGGTAATARVDVLKDGSYVGVGLDVSNAVAASDGSVDIFARQGGTGTVADWYLDYMYINSSNPLTEYYTDGDFGDWTGGVSDDTDAAIPVKPLVQYRMNDTAADTTVNNTGINTDDAIASVNVSLMTIAGIVGTALNFTSASSHIITPATNTLTSIKDDAVGSLLMWVYPEGVPSGSQDYLFNVTEGSVASENQLGFIAGNNNLGVSMNIASANRLTGNGGTLTTGTWNHIAWVQDGNGMVLYVNALTVDVTYSINVNSADKLWFGDIGTLDTIRIGCITELGVDADHFNGRLDDFRYYSTALTSTDIALLYNEGNGSETFGVTSQEATTFKYGTNSYSVTQDTVGVCMVSQTLASGSQLAGTLSILGGWFNATNSQTYKIRINDGTTDHESAVLTGNGTWQYQTFQFTPTTGAGTVKAQFLTTAAGTLLIDQVSVEKVEATGNGTDDNSDRLQRSALTLLSDWDGTDSGFNDIITAGDVGLTGLAILSDKMYIFKKYSIHRVTYTGSTPLLEIKQLISRVGTASPRTIKNVEIPGSGEVLMFLGTDRKLYIFDGFEIVPISEGVSEDNSLTDVYMKNINAQALDKCWAVVHDKNPWYEIFLPLGTSTIPTHSFVYNFITKAFWPFGNRDFKAGVISDRGDGLREVYIQENTSGFAKLTLDTNSDDGTNINGYWNSPKIGSTLLSKYDEIEVTTESVPSSTPTIAWRPDFQVNYTSKTLTASKNTHNYNPGLVDNYIQFKFTDDSSNPTFKLWSIVSLQKGLGHGK